MIRNKALSIILCVVFLLISPPQSHAEQKDTLVIGMSQFPATLHPNIDSMLAQSYAMNLTLRPITAYDADWNLVCLVCTEIPTIENGGAVITDLGDGKQGIGVTYTLHPDATWGDGTPVSTKDVEHTIAVGKNPDAGILGAEFYRRVLSVDVIDDKTFTLQMDRVDYKYNDLALYLVPEHIDRKAFAEPAQYKNKNIYDNDTYNPGLYFGPYRITKVEPGAYIEFVRNETWFGSEPHFSKIIIRIIENTAALEANLLSGSIDYIAGALGVTLDQAVAIQERHPDTYNYVFRPSLVYEHIDLNLDNPILADLKVRQALLYAIDRQAISDQLFNGKQPVAHSFVSSLDSIHNKNINRFQYDPEKAAMLLDEAGWSTIKDGFRYNSDGEPLRIEFSTTAGSRIREAVQQVLQIQWQQVGIDVRISNQPPRVLFGDTLNKREFTGMVMFAWIVSPESTPRGILHSTEIPTDENNWVGSNYMGYNNPEMDKLIDDVEVTLDRTERLKLFARIQELYMHDLPVLPLYFRSTPLVVPKWLQGIQPTGNSSTTTLWVENWTVNQ